jgi:hypothetical protein
MTPTPYILPVERIYRELASPKAPEPTPARVTAEARKLELTRDDLTAIIARKQTATPEQLQYIIDHGNDLRLRSEEKSQICSDLSMAMARRARQIGGRRDGPNAEFIAKGLGWTCGALIH